MVELTRPWKMVGVRHLDDPSGKIWAAEDTAIGIVGENGEPEDQNAVLNLLNLLNSAFQTDAAERWLDPARIERWRHVVRATCEDLGPENEDCDP